MANNNTIVVAIRSLPYQGKKIFGDSWSEIFKNLRLKLQRYGIEEPDSNNELLLFAFNHPHSALTACFDCLEGIKEEAKWDNSFGKFPIQIIFHLDQKGEVHPPIREATSKIWETLQHETFYATRSLKLQWEHLMKGKGLPAHHFEKEGSGMYQVIFSKETQIKAEKIFSHRALTAQGNHKECFYCGLKNHKAKDCPSKLLSTEFRSIAEVGYLSFSEFNDSFKKAFSNQASLNNILKAGTDINHIRKDPVLRTYVSYFDHCLIYQFRFLWHMAFTSNTTWDGAAKQERINIDSRNLQMGLDCLRVGKYKEATGLLRAENQAMAGKQFYANLGLAFISLENERKSDMIQYLEIAKGTAESEKERIYISLLISRYFDIEGHLWKSDHAIQSIYNLYIDCVEAQYRKAQISTRNGEGSTAIKLLQKLTKGYRHIFITTLIDPKLLPIEGMVEDLLGAQVQIQLQNAQESLIQAKKECEALRIWFDNEDQELLDILNTLDHLEKQYQRKSYFDLLDVAEKAKSLVKAAPVLKENRLEKLNENVDKIVMVWSEYNTYWKFYPYKLFSPGFHSILVSGKRKLVETRSLAATSFGKALNLFGAAKEDVASLKHIYKKLVNLKNLFDMIWLFGKKLIIAELVLSGMIFMCYPLMQILGDNLIGTHLYELILNPQIQKKGFFLSNLLIAPLFAFAQTLRAVNKP